MSDGVRGPQHPTGEYEVSAFDCGLPELDHWLKRRALQNESSRASRTFVIAAGKRVVGYYALATGSR